MLGLKETGFRGLLSGSNKLRTEDTVDVAVSLKDS